MKEAPYKVDITIPLPDKWVKDRDYVLNQSQATLPAITIATNITNSITGVVSPGRMVELSPEQIDQIIRDALLEMWQAGFREDWHFQVQDAWMAAREQHSNLSEHFLMFYDNTDPLKDTKGNVRFTFADLNAALMFKLSYMPN